MDLAGKEAENREEGQVNGSPSFLSEMAPM